MIQAQMRSRPQTPIRLSLFAFLLYLVGPNAVAPPREGSAAPGQATGGWPAFVDVASDSGVTVLNINGDADKDYIIEVNGNGAGFFDYDNDGDVDLLIANGSTMENHGNGGDPILVLYRNDGRQFVDVTASAGLARNGWGVGVCIADYDNDGNRDVYLTAFGPNALFHNNGDGTFTDVTGEGGADDDRWSTNCAFADYDRDGDVDLYVANYIAFSEETIPRRGESDLCNFMGIAVMCGPRGLQGEPDTLYRNNGDGTFTDVTREAGIEDPDYYGFGVAFADFDVDGWPDIYVANDSVPNLLFRNNGDGTFEEIGLVSGTAFNEQGGAQAGMGVAVGDYDANGFPDIFVTNFSHDTNTLYQNLGGMLFVDSTLPAGLGETSLPYLGWGTAFADLDNDAFLDLLVANGHVYPEIDNLDVGTRFLQPKQIYRNRGDGTFEEIVQEDGGDLEVGKSARGLALADYDNDGDLDSVAININDRPSLYRNDAANANHWITFRLEGVESNRDAIGARVRIESGGRTQTRIVRSGGSYLSHHDLRVHFGLGGEPRVEKVRIDWPNGNIQELSDIAADRFVTIRESAGIEEILEP